MQNNVVFNTNQYDVHPSVHLSIIDCLSKAAIKAGLSWCSRPPGASREMWFLDSQWVLDLPQCLWTLGHAQNTFKGKCPWGIQPLSGSTWFCPLKSATLFFWSLPTADCHEWGSEWQTGKSRASPCSSALYHNDPASWLPQLPLPGIWPSPLPPQVFGLCLFQRTC